jgi:hypothetical protein
LECQQKFNNSFFPESDFYLKSAMEKKIFEGNLGRKA